jgi:phenylacetate-CoA ligase
MAWSSVRAGLLKYLAKPAAKLALSFLIAGQRVIDQHLEVLRLLRGRLPSTDEIEAIRLRKLKNLLEYAYRHVSFYRKLFESAGLVPEDIRSVGDLRRLPVTDRDHLRAAGPDRISRKIDPASCKVMYSSGSSGKPWPVYRTVTEDHLRRAVELRSMIAAGIRPRDRIVTLGPALRAGAKQRLGQFGMFHTSFVSPLLPVEQQAEQLRALRPDVFWVYPTALRVLLQHAGTLSALIRPRMIVTSAEPLDDVLGQKVLSDHQVEMRNFYGAVEVGRVSFECPAREGLHINTDCSIVELEGDGTMPGAGKTVVITNLNLRVSPYIRYRLGDFCEMNGKPCSCGSPLPLMKPPLGRQWDVIRLPSGKLMSPWPLNSILRNLENLLQFRLVQKRTDLLVLQLQFSAVPRTGALDSLSERLKRQIGEPVTLRIETVDHFVNPALKFRAFISEVEEQVSENPG